MGMGAPKWLHVQIHLARVSESVGLGGVPQFTVLTGSQVVQMLLVWDHPLYHTDLGVC